MRVETWNIEEMTGYKPISTFYEDLSIADVFGADAIKDTFDRVVQSWLNDYRMFTEFVMALNWKCWRWYNQNDALSELYADLYYKAHDLACENFNEDELIYFYRTLD